MSPTHQDSVDRSATPSTIDVASRSRSMLDFQGEPKTADEEKQAEQSVTANVETAMDDLLYGPHPDGGLRAWLAVAGCAAGDCATFGLVNAWGVFQAYYQEEVLVDTSPSTIAWIGSLQYALIFLPGLVVGRVFDMGWTKTPMAIASAIVVAVMFLTAECTKYWHFLLCQGILLGLACGVIFGITMGCPAHWFKKRLGIAFGFSYLGSSLGGACFPIVVRNLVDQVGFKWTMRVMGFIQIALLTFQFFTVERRLPPKKRTGPFFDFSAFKSLQFSLYCCSSFIAFLGIYTVLTYIDVSASQKGVDAKFSFYLVAISNACSAIGRIAGGLLADRVGAITMMAPATFIAGVLTYIWPFVNTAGGNIAIAIIYGTASSVYVTLLAAPVVHMGKTEDVGVRVGMSMTVVAMSAVAGPPISGAIIAATGTYTYTGIYAGTTIMVACCFLLATRISILGGIWGKC
ncbi:MFS general substrate transporter [Trametes polyzona]|nr:MFS general substrate transporter [Trametes polyzona]